MDAHITNTISRCMQEVTIITKEQERSMNGYPSIEGIINIHT